MRGPYLRPAEYDRLLALSREAAAQRLFLLRRNDPVEPFQIQRTRNGEVLYAAADLDAIEDWLAS